MRSRSANVSISDDQAVQGAFGCSCWAFQPRGLGLSTTPNSPATLTASVTSPWSPFRHVTFTVLWTATVISNIGAWMYSAASGWLMTTLNPDPFIVSMVQVAASLPMFLFAVPAGAL